MKKYFLILMITITLVPKNLAAQNNGAAAAAAAGALIAIGAGIAAVEQMKERAELTATEWILANNPELQNFSLKTIDFDGKKVKDMSAASVITFKIQQFTPKEDIELDGTKHVLIGFTSHGWINEYGINFEKVKWFLLNSDKWLDMMTSYVTAASGLTNKDAIRNTLLDGKIVNRGVRTKGKGDIDFYKMDGDMYTSIDYDHHMKFVYNERSLGIFLKETQNLVQISRGSIIDIHDFFFNN
ncbi:hypothetical protein HX109_00155 [Galbibacter sp. BG1]|uniref:hypothetical protein n=1 Tax=Galbibacter sp. BG1 TaxID=1170699 RepID=UPI0015BD62F6|nr:hypothetical protein [Galbibacter sp. BG1]QLE00043.1 hypothetical protein HX109_00155 [Galbibacter sp. BG1]